MSDDNDAIDHIEAGLAQNGVACVAVSDGEIFAFTRETVQNLLVKMDESKQDRIIVFVKSGQRLRKV